MAQQNRSNLDITTLTRKWKDQINRELSDAEGIGFVLVVHDFTAGTSRIGTNFGTEDVPAAMMTAALEEDAKGASIVDRGGKDPIRGAGAGDGGSRGGSPDQR